MSKVGTNSQSKWVLAESMKLANASGLRWKEETTRSLSVPVVLANSRPSHKPPAVAKGTTAMHGIAQVAARTVPLAAHEHQKHERIKIGMKMRSSPTAPEWTNRKG